MSKTRKTRYSKREFMSVDYHLKRSPFRSESATRRQIRIDLERSRGVLEPFIRGCSVPRWFLEA